MATIFHPSTPPPPSSIHVPPTPKHGWEDNYQPYTPRKSARVSSQRARVTQTPPPHYSSRSLKKTSSTNTTSPPSSPQTANKRKAPKASNMMGGRSVSGALNEDSTVSAAEALGLSKAHGQRKMESNQSATVRRSGMLPTPAKTPKKQPSEISSGITSIARNLFPVRPETVEEVMPTPKRKGRKYTGFTLDSFEAEDDGASIQIYTDSHERVPEVDRSSDNPFYGDASNAQPEPTKRASKRRKIPVPGEEDQTIEEAEKREDGLIYVFRGKKTFRKFVDDEDSGSDVDASDADVGVTLGTTVPDRLRRPLTRSSIKPRLLFPTPEQSKAKEKRSQLTEDEEEAVTDIEEQADITSTPLDQTDEVIMTPKAPKFAPASPPTTARATRSTNKLENDDEHPPMRNGRARGGKVSPFDGWSRTKAVSGQGKKREGEPLSRTGGESSKRLRS